MILTSTYSSMWISRTKEEGDRMKKSLTTKIIAIAIAAVMLAGIVLGAWINASAKYVGTYNVKGHISFTEN